MNIERINQATTDLSKIIDNVNPEYRPAYILGIRRGVKWADSKPYWQRDRNPEFNGSYIAVKRGMTDSSEYFYKDGIWYNSIEDYFESQDGETIINPEIVAWMPFPILN